MEPATVVISEVAPTTLTHNCYKRIESDLADCPYPSHLSINCGDTDLVSNLMDVASIVAVEHLAEAGYIGQMTGELCSTAGELSVPDSGPKPHK